MRKHSRIVTIIVMIFIAVVVGASLFVFFNSAGSGIVSQTGMRDYVQEYLTEYKYLYDDPSSSWRSYLGNITYLGDFTFFAYPTFGVDAVISSKHGAALFYDSSKPSGEVSVSVIDDPIEYDLWSHMPRNTTGFPTVLVEPGDYYFDGVVNVYQGLLYIAPGANAICVNKDRPFNVTGWGAVEVLGTYTVEQTLLLKGSNAVDDWSTTQAELDAIRELMTDCRNAGVSNLALQVIQTQYEPSILLGRIASRMKSGIYRNNEVLFNTDYAQLKKAANGTMDSTVSDVLSQYYTMIQQPPTTLWEQVWNYISQSIGPFVVGVILTLVGVFINNKWGKTKKE